MALASASLVACGGGGSDTSSSSESGAAADVGILARVAPGTPPPGQSTGTGTGSSAGGTTGGTSGGTTGGEGTTSPAPAPVQAGAVRNPVLFVTQVPVMNDFASRMSTFANHVPRIQRVPRGGDLVIRYPDGTIRKLTEEAGYGMTGLQGSRAIAVREPAVHWSGTKALFSMIVGAPTLQYVEPTTRWQIYEVTGLGKGETVRITKVENQPGDYNNVSPFYGSDDRILFTSDRPRGGEAHLYPQLDEYESAPTTTGIWSLERGSGDLRLLTHSVSGAFTPFIDSVGRVIYSRWDHLQRDQQADASPATAFNFASEAAGAARVAASEVFPEPRAASTSVYGPVAGHTYNLFVPWEVNQDGTREETLNHIGRHEITLGSFDRSFVNDSSLVGYTNAGFTQNKMSIRGDGGIFHVREDPANPGTYIGIYGREFGELGSSSLVRFKGTLAMNPELMAFTDLSDPTHAGGRYRTPAPLSGGGMVASHTTAVTISGSSVIDYSIKLLNVNTAKGWYTAGAALTGGLTKSVSWWSPEAKLSYSGKLWELDPVEVVARTRPAARVEGSIDAPEKSVLAEEGVDEAALRAWMKARNLALIVTRNQTSRDRADRQQPFNLQVPGGVKTVGNGGKVYGISHYQIMQADQIRGYTNTVGRRPIAQPMRDAAGTNVPNPGGPAGSVRIAADGSTAAFVPARRALTWQTTDAGGNAVVRERVWVTFQPGEVRVCASCHGVNQADQAGGGVPAHKPEALRSLLRYWRTLPQ